MRAAASSPRAITRNVSLTAELDKFVGELVATGLFSNHSEVVRTALRNMFVQYKGSEQKRHILTEEVLELCSKTESTEVVEFRSELLEQG